MGLLSVEHSVISKGQRKRTAEDDVVFYLMMRMIQELQLRAVDPHQQELFICSLPALRNMTWAHPLQSALFEDTAANMMQHVVFFSPLFLEEGCCISLYFWADYKHIYVYYFSINREKNKLRSLNVSIKKSHHVPWMWIWLTLPIVTAPSSRLPSRLWMTTK